MILAVSVINLSPSISLNHDVPERVWTWKYVLHDYLRVFCCRSLWMFLETLGLNLIVKQGNAFLLGIVMRSLGADFRFCHFYWVRSTRRLSEAEMQFSLKFRL